MTRHLVDTSVWVAMSVGHHVHGRAAIEWFDTLDEAGSALFCRSTQQSVLRLLTTGSVFAPYGGTALSGEEAWSAFDRLVADTRVGFYLDEPEGFDVSWRGFTSRPTASPKLWMDGYLAALAVAAGLRFVTTDSAFRQFPGLDLLVLGSATASA